MRKIILFILAMTVGDVAMAAGWNASEHLSTWGGGSVQVCRGDEVKGSKICIGSSANNDCKPLGSGDGNQATIMMIATGISDKYAVFCPIQLDTSLYTKKKGGVQKGTVYTLYRYPDRYSSTQCVKLYIKYTTNKWDGIESALDKSRIERLKNKPKPITDATDKFHFENLERKYGSLDKLDEPACDATLLSRDAYSGNSLAPKGSANIEDRIGMFSWDNPNACGNDKGTLEHDVVLAIVDWTPGGHGAFVQPMQVSAKRNSLTNKTVNAWLDISYANGSVRKLACKIGYKANADNTNCEPMDLTLCPMSEEDKKANICKNLNKDKYDETKHTLTYNNASSCYVFMCLQPGYAFPDTSSFECEKCSGDIRQGINPTNGVCVKCPVGKVFDANALDSECCADAKVYSKNDLQYGPGKSADTALDSQCWTKGSDEYLKCIKGTPTLQPVSKPKATAAQVSVAAPVASVF